MIRVEPATPAMIAEMVAEIDDPRVATVQALAVYRDSELGGLAGHFVLNGRAVVFSRIDGKLPPQTIVKVARRVLDIASETGLPVVAMPDPDIPGSKRFLERLGFKFSEET